MFFIQKFFLIFMLLFTAIMCAKANSNAKQEPQHKRCLDINKTRFERCQREIRGHGGSYSCSINDKLRDKFTGYQKRVDRGNDGGRILYNIIKNNNNPPWKSWKKQGST